MTILSQQFIDHYTKMALALDEDIAHIDHKIKHSLDSAEIEKLKDHKQRLVDEKLNYLGMLDQ